MTILRRDEKNPHILSTPSGARLNTHAGSAECAKYGCVIHNPTLSDPANSSTPPWPLNWREDRGFMERICPCGIGHPDMDGLRWIERTRGAEVAEAEGVHGCCGCCAALTAGDNVYIGPANPTKVHWVIQEINADGTASLHSPMSGRTWTAKISDLTLHSRGVA